MRAWQPLTPESVQADPSLSGRHLGDTPVAIGQMVGGPELERTIDMIDDKFDGVKGMVTFSGDSGVPDGENFAPAILTVADTASTMNCFPPPIGGFALRYSLLRVAARAPSAVPRQLDRPVATKIFHGIPHPINPDLPAGLAVGGALSRRCQARLQAKGHAALRGLGVDQKTALSNPAENRVLPYVYIPIKPNCHDTAYAIIRMLSEHPLPSIEFGSLSYRTG